MQQYAIIENNVVVNVVDYADAPTADELAPFGAGAIAVLSNGAGPGWTYSNGVLTNPVAPPPPPTPPTIAEQAAAIPSIPAWKIEVVLSEQPSPTNAGKTLADDADTLIATQPRAVQIAWAKGADVAYTSPTMLALCGALGITTAQFDQMWVQADRVSL